MATLKDVAQRAGVTVTTISRMLNNRVNVSAKTRAKIEKAMQELDYQPNELAQSLIKGRTNFIGLVVPSARNFFFSMVIDGIERYVSENGYKLLLCISDLDACKEKEYFDMLKANKVAGVILASHTQDLEKSSLPQPLLTIDRIISETIPSVCVDNYAGGRMAAEHLLERGCHRLVYISGSKDMDMDANKRWTGFRDVCLERGVGEPHVIDAQEELFIRMEYRELIRKLFRRYPETDGIFASNDIIAVQVLQYCAEADIPVPERLKVVGYDDVELASLCIPQLTTIHQPVDAICRCAVQNILAAARGETIPNRVTFPVTLVVRQSS